MASHINTARACLIIGALCTGSCSLAQAALLTSINGLGVTATVTDYSLVGNAFTFKITNTSPATNPGGALTNIGFDLPGDRPNTYAILSSTSSRYRLFHDISATSGAQNFVSSFDFLLYNGKGNGNVTFGGGSINTGIIPGASVTFTISGDFSGLSADSIMQGIYGRFQGLPGNNSDVVHYVPEPSLAAMTVVGGLLLGMRRRPAKADVQR